MYCCCSKDEPSPYMVAKGRNELCWFSLIRTEGRKGRGKDTYKEGVCGGLVWFETDIVCIWIIIRKTVDLTIYF